MDVRNSHLDADHPAISRDDTDARNAARLRIRLAEEAEADDRFAEHDGTDVRNTGGNSSHHSRQMNQPGNQPGQSDHAPHPILHPGPGSLDGSPSRPRISESGADEIGRSDRTITASVFTEHRETLIVESHMGHQTSQMSMSAANSRMMGDAPACASCGHITVRSGACYKCTNCGAQNGCG